MTEKQHKTEKLSTEPYKGVRDFYPNDMRLENYIFGVWRRTLESFGYEEYNASILEPTELYEAKSGEEIINEQTYSFVDRGERNVTLRPEMTPTVARMVAAQKRELAYPLRWYSIPNLFRYERPQRGRLREHFQLNADIFGIGSNKAEIEIIEIASNVMKNFGIKDSDFEIRISSRRLINAVMSEWYELDAEKGQQIQKLIDRKKKMSHEEFEIKAQEITGDAFKFFSFDPHDEVYEEAMGIPSIRDAKRELDDVIDDLSSRGIDNVVFDTELVRGFDYYTGIVFEVFDKHPENNRSVFGGGRYDELLSLFDSESIPAVGFGLGDVVIKDMLETYDLIPQTLVLSTTHIALLPLNEDCIAHAEKVAKEIRKQGLNVAINFSEKKIGDQIRYAEKTHIPFIIVIGEDEMSSELYTLKNLETGKEIKVKADEVGEKMVS